MCFKPELFAIAKIAALVGGNFAGKKLAGIGTPGFNPDAPDPRSQNGLSGGAAFGALVGVPFAEI